MGDESLFLERPAEHCANQCFAQAWAVTRTTSWVRRQLFKLLFVQRASAICLVAGCVTAVCPPIITRYCVYFPPETLTRIVCRPVLRPPEGNFARGHQRPHHQHRQHRYAAAHRLASRAYQRASYNEGKSAASVVLLPMLAVSRYTSGIWMQHPAQKILAVSSSAV